MSILDSYQTYRQQPYFQSLDGVRFLSIIAVIWHHSYPPGLPDPLGRGFLGVDMFFVLSGYLIVTLLLREKDANSQQISLRNFYIRRALRIFPVYFGVLLALSVVYGVLKSDDPDAETFFSLLPVYLTFLANWSLIHAQNLGIYWSLATEEQFYLLWPLIEKLCAPKTTLGLLLIFIGMNQLVNFGVLDPLFMWLYGQEHPIELHILDSTFTPICLGVLLAHLLHNKMSFVAVYGYLQHPACCVIIFLMMLLAIVFSRGDLAGIERLLIQSSMCLWLAALVIREGHWFKPIMTFGPIKRMGQISYGMYVYHMFALHIVREVLARFGIDMPYALFILGLLITVIIAELSFRLYESPILSLNRKFKAVH